MGKHESFARELNDIATAAFEEYRKSEKSFADAEKQRKLYPRRFGVAVDPEYLAKSARAEANYLGAKELFRKAQQEFSSHLTDISTLRGELVSVLEDEYAADPKKLDHDALELLRSGVLRADEYVRLMDSAEKAENFTMMRLIAKYAGDAAESVNKRYGENSEQARNLRAISYRANQINGDDSLSAFDVLADVYKRATTNPAMIDQWENFYSEVADLI